MNVLVKKNYIIFTFVLLFSPLVSSHTQGFEIDLMLPKDNAVVTEDTLNFKWKCPFDINRYLLIITIGDGSFKREIIVFDNNTEIIYTLKNVKKILNRSGSYKWQIKALQPGKELLSPVRSFKIRLNNNKKSIPPSDYVHAVEFQIVNRHRTLEFNDFLKNVNSKYSFQDFKSLGIVFRQNGLLFSFLDFLEKIYLLSQTGMGFSVNSRMNLDKNVYFSFYPAVDVSSMWFSTGINRFSSKITSSAFGFDLELMPRKFITVSTRWLSTYKIQYADKNGELNIFNGKGWQVSLKFVISNNIIRKFNLFGMKIDFEKLPIRLTYNKIKDCATDHIIETQMIYFIFLI